MNIHQIEVCVLVVPARRGIGQAAAVVLEQGTGVTRFAIREQGDLACIDVKAIELVPLASADVLGEDEGVLPCRVVDCFAYRVREECELLACSARRAHQVNFVGIGKARGDQHLSLRGAPAEELGGSRIAVTFGGLGNRRRDRWHVFEDDVIPRLDVRSLLARALAISNAGKHAASQSDGEMLSHENSLHGPSSTQKT